MRRVLRTVRLLIPVTRTFKFPPIAAPRTNLGIQSKPGLPCEMPQEGAAKQQSLRATRRHSTPVRAIQGDKNAAPVQRGTVGNSHNQRAEYRLRRNGVRVRSPQPSPSSPEWPRRCSHNEARIRTCPDRDSRLIQVSRHIRNSCLRQSL